MNKRNLSPRVGEAANFKGSTVTKPLAVKEEKPVVEKEEKVEEKPDKEEKKDEKKSK